MIGVRPGWCRPHGSLLRGVEVCPLSPFAGRLFVLYYCFLSLGLGPFEAAPSAPALRLVSPSCGLLVASRTPVVCSTADGGVEARSPVPTRRSARRTVRGFRGPTECRPRSRSPRSNRNRRALCPRPCTARRAWRRYVPAIRANLRRPLRLFAGPELCSRPCRHLWGSPPGPHARQDSTRRGSKNSPWYCERKSREPPCPPSDAGQT